MNIVTLLFVGIALCSKETGILAAPLLVGVDLAVDPLGVTPLRKRISRLALPCFPVAAYLIFVLSIPVYLPKIQAAVASASAGAATGYTQQSLRALWVYLELAVFPRNLAILRELHPSSHPALSAWVAGALFAAGLALSAYLLVQGRNRLIGLALFLFSFPFAPYLFIKLNLVVNENRMYLPLAGLALGVALASAWSLSGWVRGHRGRRAIVGIGTAMLILVLLRGWKLS
ncbi:MAG: hypothetical protein GTO24_17810, partial [candidate division Zixibacteria bacterium]|nr:hypothetical protein [candidate division Zixibacteria bacterium]